MQDIRPEPNLYAPPASEIRGESPAGALQAHTFYVVSIPKFCVLYVATFGVYGLYWFYMHWQRYRRGHGQHESIWPVPRALFSIFFTHALVARMPPQHLPEPGHALRLTLENAVPHFFDPDSGMRLG